MEEFTIDEKSRINRLYGTDFEDATFEDIKLIQRWENIKAKREAENNAKTELLQTELNEKLRIASEQAQYAANALDELKEAALARLKAVE